MNHPTVDTMADGIGVRRPIPEAVVDMRGLVDDALLVQDESLIAAMRLAHQHLGLVVEPSGVAGIAALLEQGGDSRHLAGGDRHLWRQPD